MGFVIPGLQALGSWLVGGSVLAGIVTNIALSYVISAISGGRKSASTEAAARDLALPRSLPPKRFVYGETRVYGTPAPVRVKGPILYACMILNSRPSESVERIWIDKRELESIRPV